MPSEITGLEPLHGYLKTGNLVVPMSFRYIQLPKKQADYIERKMNAEPRQVSKASANAAKENDDGDAPLKISPQEVKQIREKQLKRSEQRQQRFFE